MNKIPNHLIRNFDVIKTAAFPDNSFKLSGEIKCDCGANIFSLFKTKKFKLWKKNFIGKIIKRL